MDAARGKKSIIVDARVHRNAKLAALPSHAARWAFVVMLCEAKWQEPEGTFRSREHLAACLGPDLTRYVRHFQNAGLLDVSEAGYVVHDWPQWQISSAAMRKRRQRYLAALGG